MHKLRSAGWYRHSVTLTLVLVVIGALITIHHSLYVTHGGSEHRPFLFDISDGWQNTLWGERKLVLLLPASGPSINLCKVVASAIALGYPSPVIVNWDESFGDEGNVTRLGHLEKITGTLEYLRWATSDDAHGDDRLGEDDLVLAMDAHDIWLQLPPSILIDRYYRSIHRANSRLSRKYGPASTELIQQTIIASAQKGCVAPNNKVSNLHCNDVPESTLPRNVFGFFTDYKFGRHKYVRPKYLNSGSFLGPVGDMRKLFQRVQDRMEQNLLHASSKNDLKGDQGIFAEIFGEQEVWRQQLTVQNVVTNEKRREALARSAEEFEYRLGLDYTQELIYPTCYSEHSGSFVRASDTQDLIEQSNKAGVAPPRFQGVPNDLQKLQGPLEGLQTQTGKTQTWGDVALYVDHWTTVFPVALHHNAWRHGEKGRIETWWNKTWYFPFLRNLLEQHSRLISTEPLFDVETTKGNFTVWPYRQEDEPKAAFLLTDHDGSRNFSLASTSWDGICRSADDAAEENLPWYQELLRDGKGALDPM